MDSVFADCPALHVLPEFVKLIDNGNAFYVNQTVEKKRYEKQILVRVYGNDKFYGVFSYEEEKRRYKPVKMFLAE